MSQFDYKHLQEENPEDDAIPSQGIPSENESDNTLETLTSTSHKKSKHDSYESVNQGKSHGAKNESDVKYTALRPTRVVEEGYDNDFEDNFGSLIQLNTHNIRRRRKCRRYHVLICVLLSIALVIIGSFLVYFFLIFPSTHGKVVFPDGQIHTEDLAKLKKLGSNVVVTSCGLVRGVNERGVNVFKGIPYAVPPRGKRRWKAPEPLSYDSGTCWRDVFNASQFGSKCVQPTFSDSNVIEGSENCLFLNIWTPALEPENNFSVMVWLHSGDLVHGSGNMPGMTPTPELAKATQAVYVSLNYRLGVFGFLAVNALRKGREPFGSAGNYGIMDQQLALKWIKDNIRHFGGNENDITVFGHGSGATSIQALLASHWSHGLFQKAWISSPVAIINKTIDDACKDNQKIMVQTGCRSADCLRALNEEEVTKASPWSLEPFWTLDQLFYAPFHSQIRNELAIFDGHIVLWSPENTGPIGVDVSVVLGTTYFELSSLATEKAVINMSDNEFSDLLVHYTSLYGTDAVIQMKRLYSNLPHLHYTSPRHFPPKPSVSLAHLVGDIRNVCPLKLLASSMKTVFASPIFMYTAEIYPSHNLVLSENETNCFVGWDILAFFYSFDELNFVPGQGDVNFRNVIRKEIMSFVKKGRPISSHWKTVDQNTGIIEKGVAVKPSSFNYFEHCDFWDSHEFFKYSWRKKSHFS